MSIFTANPFRRRSDPVDVIPPAERRPTHRAPIRLGGEAVIEADFRDLGRSGASEAAGGWFAEVPRPARPATPGRNVFAQPAGSGFAHQYGFWLALAGLSLTVFWVTGGYALAAFLRS